MNEGRICFLTKLIPTELYENVLVKSKNNMQDAANALQWHIYEGLCENYGDQVTIINTLPIGSFPQYYSDPFVTTSKFSTKYGNDNINLGFCNIKLIRKHSLSRKIYNALINIFKDCTNGILYIYTISSEFMEAITKFKKVKPEIKVCAIIADLPNMSSLSTNDNVIRKIFISYTAKKSFDSIDSIDAFALLTKQMADYMHIDKPYCVIEGISTATSEYESSGGMPICNESDDLKTILYTGTLHRKFGIIQLLEAFAMIKKNNYRLVICGAGDSEDEINKYAKMDPRIDFKGQLSRNEILKLQKQATVLVNPRQNNEEFTKYSFPSKIMEYLSSGTPVVAYKLDGVPDEYEKYLFYIENNTVEALSNKLMYVCEMDLAERVRWGEKGRDFVINEKNSIRQVSKIISIMNTL